MGDDDVIRVVIVDDQVVVRGGLKYFLSTAAGINVVGEAQNGDQAVLLCRQLQPDVVLMDLCMPELDGVQATQIIHELFPHIRIIALTNFEQHDLILKVMQAGAIGYLLKDVSPGDLVEAIRAARAGRATLAPGILSALVQPTTDLSPLGQDLTKREEEVLALVVGGFSNVQIAAQLDISRNTVRFHVRNILAKLDAANRTEAASLAVKYGLVTK